MNLRALPLLAVLIGCPDPPAAAPPPTPAPAPEPSPASAPLVVLAGNSVATGVHAVPIACVLDGVVRPGPVCRDAVAVGSVAQVPLAGLTTLGAPVVTPCPASDATAPAWEAAVVAPDAASWGWLGARAPARADVSTRPGPPDRPDTTVVLEGEIDGEPGDERIVRRFHPSDDPEKPGNSTLFLHRDGVTDLVEMASDEPFNGVVDLLAALPLAEGHLLVVRSTWSGGQGLHAFVMASGAFTPIGAWVCGS